MSSKSKGGKKKESRTDTLRTLYTTLTSQAAKIQKQSETVEGLTEEYQNVQNDPAKHVFIKSTYDKLTRAFDKLESYRTAYATIEADYNALLDQAGSSSASSSGGGGSRPSSASGSSKSSAREAGAWWECGVCEGNGVTTTNAIQWTADDDITPTACRTQASTVSAG
ncbi:hypothetical protein B0T26DRAFT_797132 [Lasiosphaeria miniovina]|uniref:Uncharacterized protein n=1 Tax=Lasiosphaeria miniovina TaxID=1954250 RepID=A0AA40BEW3_9PEZI|nr:uncharacterized protein B0T26DRAFT_797132 [Lasiosphaeria miniovina]KAK0732977.1 hypothetical protein B0T26DRAFT_797132 [Lasiosphaeria miniovina]